MIKLSDKRSQLCAHKARIMGVLIMEKIILHLDGRKIRTKSSPDTVNNRVVLRNPSPELKPPIMLCPTVCPDLMYKLDRLDTDNV